MKAKITKVGRWLLFVLPVISGIVSFILENSLSAERAERFTMGLQFVIGNFPNSRLVDITSPWFSVAVAFRFGLAYAACYGAGMIFLRLARLEKEQTMKFIDLLKDRDLAIEQQILNGFPPEARDKYRPQVISGIEKAGEQWARKYLPILVGGSEAASRALETEVRVNPSNPF